MMYIMFAHILTRGAGMGISTARIRHAPVVFQLVVDKFFNQIKRPKLGLRAGIGANGLEGSEKSRMTTGSQFFLKRMIPMNHDYLRSLL
jgi:hypothetical protein